MICFCYIQPNYIFFWLYELQWYKIYKISEQKNMQILRIYRMYTSGCSVVDVSGSGDTANELSSSVMLDMVIGFCNVSAVTGTAWISLVRELTTASLFKKYITY